MNSARTILGGTLFAGALVVLPVHADLPALPPHPRLLLDSNGIALLKQRIATPWAAAEWNQLKTAAGRRLGRPVELPPRGGNWSHNYVCPTHGARLAQGRKIGEWQWEHRCPVGPHILRGDPTKATLDFDGNVISSVHFDLAREVADHGLVFQVTGDGRHAARAREILLAYAGRYLSYPMHNNQGVAGRGGRVASQSLTEASWLIEITQGADLVWNTLGDADRDAIRHHLLMPALNEIILKSRLGIHNIQCRLNSAIGLVGFLLGDTNLIARAIDDPALGYRQQMDKGVLTDGMWTEGSSGYHFFTINGVWPLTEAARNCGLDQYGTKLKSMFDAPLTFVMPDFTLPDFNDSGSRSIQNESPLYELGFARYRNPAYVPLLAESTRRNRMALLFGDMALPSGIRTELRSRNSPASGYAILQRGQQQDATWLCLKYGPHGGGHGHPDKNNFILFARGQVLAPDGGTHAYGSPLHKDWDQTTVAHNTLVVDETTQQRAQGRSIAFGAEQGLDYSITDAGPIYSDTRFTRAAVLLTHDLIVFVDQVQAAKPSTLDISYHQSGTWESLPSGRPWTAPAVPGYKHFSETTTRPLGVDGLVLQTSVRKDWKPSIVLAAGGEPAEIITGYGILKTTEQRVPWLLQRRRAQATAFVWALSLDGAPVQLNILEVQDLQGRTLNRADAVLVDVQDASHRWQLLVNPQKQSVVASLPGATAWHSDVPFAARTLAK